MSLISLLICPLLPSTLLTVLTTMLHTFMDNVEAYLLLSGKAQRVCFSLPMGDTTSDSIMMSHLSSFTVVSALGTLYKVVVLGRFGTTPNRSSSSPQVDVHSYWQATMVVVQHGWVSMDLLTNSSWDPYWEVAKRIAWCGKVGRQG